MAKLAIKIPDVGEGVTEVELVAWHVKEGDHVREDDIIAEVMTDKATVEIPSAYDGQITWLCGDTNKSYAVGEALVYLEGEGLEEEVLEENASATPPEKVKLAPAAATIELTSQNSKVLASPSLRKRAREHNIDLTTIKGSGPKGRILYADLEKATSKPPSPSAQSDWVKDINIAGLRRKIAERMSAANSQIPHITIVEEVDVEAIEALREVLNQKDGQPRLTLLPFIIKALAKTLDEMPEFNAHFDAETQTLRQFGAKHIGIATATEQGLTVPVIKHAEALSLRDCGTEIRRLSELARTQKATRGDLTGSTVTITSLGPLGAVATTPIINLPEVMILGVNKMAVRPVWNGSTFLPRKQMNLSASFDHRIIDGWEAAQFMQRIKTLIETPALIFMDE